MGEQQIARAAGAHQRPLFGIDEMPVTAPTVEHLIAHLAPFGFRSLTGTRIRTRSGGRRGAG
jgi:hypothetical protein